MANKALAKRQKMTIRAEPARSRTKPRNPFAIAAGQRMAGQHRKSASGLRQEENQEVKKRLKDPEDPEQD